MVTISHSGDVMTPTGGSHVIRLNLAGLPQRVTDLFFVLSAYHCRDLSRFHKPSVRLLDADNPDHELTKYQISQAGTSSAVVMCSVSREADGRSWSVSAYGKKSSGTVRDYTEIAQAVLEFQQRFPNWRNRFWLLRLSALWQRGRLFPNTHAAKSNSQEGALCAALFDGELPDVIMRTVVSFL